MGDGENSDFRNGTSTIDPTVAHFVSEFLQYKLGQNGYQWNSPLLPSVADDTAASSTAKAGTALRTLADEFAMQFKEQFVEMCNKLDINADTMKPTIEGVADELFIEGIKWARIVAFFVFGSELAVHCKDRNWTDLINIIAYSQSEYISKKLLPWIKEHGGWDGLVKFNDGDVDQAGNRWPSLKNLLCVGLSALGAITLGAVLSKS